MKTKSIPGARRLLACMCMITLTAPIGLARSIAHAQDEDADAEPASESTGSTGSTKSSKSSEPSDLDESADPAETAKTPEASKSSEALDSTESAEPARQRKARKNKDDLVRSPFTSDKGRGGPKSRPLDGSTPFFEGADLNNPLRPEARAAERNALLEPPPPWYRRLNFRLAYGQGSSTNDFEKPEHTDLSIGIPWGGFQMGPYYRIHKARYDQDIEFPATGYSETRKYELKAIGFGAWASLDLSSRLALVVAGGTTQTESTLLTVTSTAPLGSSLTPGSQGKTGAEFSYRAGLAYEIPLGKLGLGAEAGYSSSSAKPESEIREIYCSLFLKLHTHRPKPPEKPLKPAKPQRSRSRSSRSR